MNQFENTTYIHKAMCMYACMYVCMYVWICYIRLKCAHWSGLEIWLQSKGQIDAFVMSAGTGGTIAGVSRLANRLLAYMTVYMILILIYCKNRPCFGTGF